MAARTGAHRVGGLTYRTAGTAALQLGSVAATNPCAILCWVRKGFPEHIQAEMEGRRERR